MSIDKPIDNIHDLIDAMLNGVNPIYVKSAYYMKKLDTKNRNKCKTLLAETIQIAYAYGCEFIEVSDE